MTLAVGQRFYDFKIINNKVRSIAEKDGIKLAHRDSKTITEQEVNEGGFNKDLKYHHLLVACEKSGTYKPKKGSAAAEGRTPLKNKR